MKINKNPSRRAIVTFCLTWALVASAAGGLLFWRHHAEVAKGLWIAGICVGLLGSLVIPFGRAFYRMWMGLASGINWLITRALLAVIFYGVLTPLALFFKLIGRDALEIKKGQRSSYWHDHDRISDPSAYQHLY